jgi:glycosyltransferase involved in cell wall biosynthesis
MEELGREAALSRGEEGEGGLFHGHGHGPRPAAERPWKASVVVPAFDAERTIGGVLLDLRRELGEPILVVDDGSRDGTAEAARAGGAEVVRHARNRGKGAAIATGLREARQRGADVVLTVDADGQHPASSAREVLFASPDPHALVLGVRDLAGEGAPRANRFSNGISNYFLSIFARQPLADTQCGLRRYPVNETLALGARAEGYAFEAEVLLRAARRGLPIVQRGVHVVYPPEKERVTHFHSVKDPIRIIFTVLRTMRET